MDHSFASGRTMTKKSSSPQEMDYREAYLDIAMEMANIFPRCEVTTVDMVRLLIHENDTFRLALKIPSRRSVVLTLENEAQ
jgi:hypothetical protein